MKKVLKFTKEIFQLICQRVREDAQAFSLTEWVGIGIVAAAGITGLLLLAFGFAALFAFPVMFFWNQSMPDLFALSPINWWQAFCLMCLCAFLFRSSGASASYSKDK